MLSPVPVKLPGLPGSILDGPVELEAPVDLDELDDFPDGLDDRDGGLFRSRRSLAQAPGEQHQQAHDTRREPARSDEADRSGAPVPLPRRGTPKLVSSHGRPVTEQGPRRARTGKDSGPSDPSRRDLRSPGVLRTCGSLRKEAGARTVSARGARACPAPPHPAGGRPEGGGRAPGGRDGSGSSGSGRAAPPCPAGQSGPAVEGGPRPARLGRRVPHRERSGSRRARRR